MKTEYSQLWYI